MTIRGSLAVTLMVTLSVSPAANLMIAGLLVSRLAGPEAGRRRDKPDRLTRHPRSASTTFRPKFRWKILDQVRVRQSELNDDIGAIRAAEQRMFRAMRADPFGRVALDAAFADVLSRRGPASS